MYYNPCDGCSDSYLTKMKNKQAVKDKAFELANENEKAYAIYEAEGQWQIATAEIAVRYNYPKTEIIFGLPRSAKHI